MYFRILIFTTIFSFSLFAQTFSYSGTVLEKSTGEALIGANVYLDELNFGASTNISGYFVIPNIPKGNYTLIVSYVGFKTEEVKINVQKDCQNCITIELNDEAVQTGEVVVSADSVRTIDKLFAKSVSKIDLTPRQLNQIPQAVESDLLRSLQTLPGITSLSDFSSALYVRGGTPDQNLYLVDGTDVYNPEHAFGIFSTFNTQAIKKVEMSKGGFGAEYGGRLSSVLDVTNLDGNRKEFVGNFNLSLLSASTTLQMPVGSIGSISGSFRRTYFDQTIAKWIDDIPQYYFYDGNLKGYFDLDKSNKLTFSVFNSRDDLDFKLDPDAEESLSFLYNWGNLTGSLNWKHIFSTKLFASFWATASRFNSNFDFDAVEFTEHNKLTDYAAKGALEYYYSKNLNIKFGLEQKILHLVLKQDANTGKVDVDVRRQHTAGYITTDWMPSERLTLQFGLRSNLFNTNDYQFDLAPRFTAKYRLTDNSNLKFAAGRYFQYLNRIPRLFFSSIWISADENIKPSSSDHFILGYQQEIGAVYEFEVEAYYKTYKDIYQYNQLLGSDVEASGYDENGNPIYSTSKGVFTRGDGHSYGIEFLLRKDVGALTGWVSYSLSKTEHKFDGINQDKYYTPRHDRTHIVNAVLNTNLTELFSGSRDSESNWIFSMNFVYASGQPITTPGSAYYINPLPAWDNIPVSGGEGIPGYKLYPSDINTFRLPDYMRMDLSITWENNFDSWSISPYLQIFNIGNRGNVWFVNYNREFNSGNIEQKIDKTNMLPILPSIGVKINF